MRQGRALKEAMLLPIVTCKSMSKRFLKCLEIQKVFTHLLFLAIKYRNTCVIKPLKDLIFIDINFFKPVGTRLE